MSQLVRAAPREVQGQGFCTAQETANMMNRQPIKWEKIFKLYVSAKELISKYKELIQLNSKIIQLKHRQMNGYFCKLPTGP